MSLCESNCEYKGYNSTIKKAECNCEVKNKISLISEIIENKDEILNKFSDIKSSINLSVMKCYYTLFNLEVLKNNIGNYILLSMINISICCFIIYLFKGNKMINNIIDKVIPNKKNINQNINRNDIKNKNNNIRKKKKKKRNKKNYKNLKMNNNNIINIINIDNNNEKKNKKKIKISNNPPIKKIIKRNQKFIKRYINNIETNGEDKNVNFSSNLEINNINNLNKKGKNINSAKSILNNNILSNNNKQNLNNNSNTIIYNDYELNSLEYKEALLIDKRSYIQYYFSLLRLKQILIFTFYTYNDYNLRIIKICLFLFNFSLYYTVNALFFNDSTMHKIYEDHGNFIFIYQIQQILYSSLICSIINILVTYLSLFEKNILSLKNYKTNIEEKIKLVLKCLKIKLTFFFILLFLFLILFWYYISCFCAIYINTQIHLIKDTLISFSFSLIYPIGLCLIPGIFRIPSLRSKNPDKECFYKISKIIQLI